MKRSKIRAAFLFILTLTACSRSDRDFRERQDANMRVQVTRMKSQATDTAMVTYRLRLVPSATFRTIHPDLGADHFWYRMDSCFYLNDKGRPRYPLLVQPVEWSS
ncbi:MAG: hypothetical protein EOO09_22655 [Chitinophagaceae bacterium]|nr:MAG: hypothetical protein EOO09_22655 [Chitinophagaceae bacterium]